MLEDISIMFQVFGPELAAWLALAFMILALVGYIYGHFHAEYVEIQEIKEDEYLLNLERKKIYEQARKLSKMEK
jgi:uncharacterized membrane protein YqaE (UPF0057 family)